MRESGSFHAPSRPDLAEVTIMTHRTRPLFRALLLPIAAAVLLVGCTTETPVDALGDASPADVDPTTLEQADRTSSTYGEVLAIYASDPDQQLQPTRRIEAKIVFKVYERSVASQSSDAPTARGTFEYEDNWGDRFSAVILYARFEEDGTATFWGPLQTISPMLESKDSASWIFVRVYDEDERLGTDRLTFQLGPPHPQQDTRLPDTEGTAVEIEDGDIVVESVGLKAMRLF
jgi:hypothetical protein